MNNRSAIIVTEEVTERASIKSGTYRWYLHPGSNVFLIHEYNDSDDLSVDITFELGLGSTLVYVPLITKARSLSITVHLHERASAQVCGAYVYNGIQRSSIKTRQEHNGSHSTSILRLNGIATGYAQVEYSGMIAINESARASNAHQENKTILLSEHATAVSIPSLEVLNNDVQCGHGSAVGPLQKEQLRYAQARGIPLRDAHIMLMSSYFEQTFAGILQENVRHEIVAQLIHKAFGE